ncbi:hypothetical protein PHMEG_0009430 [Phytophthora megakarya]|uniref:Uncharacterized protein n=1 Tax=Phytophthora megakarya TaxID=4795 RepID=A0A225WGJ6_9STRA|nr:hypothetical protein PHMEG_0009430 [Phytophthora megakarya]
MSHQDYYTEKFMEGERRDSYASEGLLAFLESRTDSVEEVPFEERRHEEEEKATDVAAESAPATAADQDSQGDGELLLMQTPQGRRLMRDFASFLAAKLAVGEDKDESMVKDTQTKEEDVEHKDEGDIGTADLFMCSRLAPIHDRASVPTAPVNTAPIAKKSSIKKAEEEVDEDSYQAGTMYFAAATREYIRHLERAVQGGPKEFSDPEVERFLNEVLKATLQLRHKPPTAITSQISSKKLGQSTESRAGGDGLSTVTGSPIAPTTVTETMTPSNSTTPRRMSMMAIPSYGGHSIGPTPGGSNRAAWYFAFYPQVQSTPGSGSQPSAAVTFPTSPTVVIPAIVPAGTTSTTGDSTHNVQMVAGIPTELRNAVKVILPFQSEKASYERAAAFWRSFEKCTNGMRDDLQLTAIEQFLKGKTGQEWWYNSRIENLGN